MKMSAEVSIFKLKELSKTVRSPENDEVGDSSEENSGLGNHGTSLKKID